MSAHSGHLVKISLLILIASAIFIFSPKIFPQLSFSADQDVVINEVFPNPSGSTSEPNEFVELYNRGSETIAIGNWTISDILTTPKTFTIPETTLVPGGFVSFRRETTKIPLNNPGDGVELRNSEGALIDSMTFDSTIEDRSWSRIPDGTGEFVNDTEPSESAPNSNYSPTPTQSPTPTPSPTPTSVPQTATYKINEVKDENGSSLSSVKVYLDGVYLHHYAPEALTFCDGCKCDTYVACVFGSHTVKLEKSGYQDWSDSRMMNAGESHEVNPVMKKVVSASPTTANQTPTPASTPTLKPISVLGATMASLPLEQIFDLSRQTTAPGFFPLATTDSASPSGQYPLQSKFGSWVLIAGGLVVLASSALFVFREVRGRVREGKG